MIRPAHITFTGCDDATDIDGMVALSAEFPIEWGILFSPKYQGQGGRYPSLDFVKALSDTKGLILSAHLCGAHAYQVFDMASSQYSSPIAAHMARAQINTAATLSQPAFRNVREWAHSVGVRPILQCRGAFPADPSIQWLFDASGGRGISPAAWPRPTQPWCGYAGGLNPANVVAAVAAISEMNPTRYWIDMETGVRDENDRFDLARCRAVCEAVYGPASQTGGAA